MVERVAGQYTGGSPSATYASVTTLIDDVHYASMKAAHPELAAGDVFDRAPATHGTLMHTGLELILGASPLFNQKVVSELDAIGDEGGFVCDTVIQEARVSIRTKDGLFTTSGQFDRLEYDSATKRGILLDWKNPTKASFRGGYSDDQYQKQFNLYRLMIFREYGITVDKGYVMYYLRDWYKSEGLETPTDSGDFFIMPVGAAIYTIPAIEKWFEESAFVWQRDFGKTKECSEKNRWYKEAVPEKWALMRKGLKRAVKLYGTEAEALAAVRSDGESVQYRKPRPEANTRCDMHCQFRGVCPRYTSEKIAN